MTLLWVIAGLVAFILLVKAMCFGNDGGGNQDH